MFFRKRPYVDRRVIAGDEPRQLRMIRLTSSLAEILFFILFDILNDETRTREDLNPVVDMTICDPMREDFTQVDTTLSKPRYEQFMDYVDGLTEVEHARYPRGWRDDDDDDEDAS